MIEERFFQEAASSLNNQWQGISNIIDLVKKILEYADVCGEKERIIALADNAIDMVVAIDIPNIPNWVELMIDKALAELAKKQVRDMVNRICPD